MFKRAIRKIRKSAKKPTLEFSGGPPLLWLFPLLLWLNAACAGNALQNHPSPYLAMHGQDPVHWQTLSGDTLLEARRSGRLILVSSGYFACYWCRRLHEEVFSQPDAAEVINRHTLPVKVDRELSPDVDAWLIEFSRRTTGRAGWPIQVLLTPEGLPFYAFFYQPKDRFIATVRRAAKLWRTQPERIRKAARAALPDPEPYDPTARPTLTAAELKRLLVDALRARMDDFAGGLKGQQKFPETPLLRDLLHLDPMPEDIRDWFTLTLDAMASGHLRDHIDGGFFRYTVDPDWHTPHYEKMLYDNAQLAELYLLAGQKFNRQDWIEVGRETLDFIQRRLRNPATGLYAGSLSAMDAHHEEGGSYLLTRRQLETLLTPTQFQIVRRAWQLDQPGPWEGKWLPEPIDHPAWPAIRQRLQDAFTPPPRDDKQPIGWNALMVNALAAAARLTPSRNRAAGQLLDRLHGLLADETPAPRALNADGQPIGEATLEDYALTIRAARALNRPAQPLQRIAERKFLTATGWRLSAAPLLPGMAGKKWLPDDDLPSLTAIMDIDTPANIAAAEPAIRRHPLASTSYLKTLSYQ